MKKLGLSILLSICFLTNSISQNDSLQFDSTEVKKESRLKKVFRTANMSFGYDYGLLPFLVDVNPPQGNFKMQGSAGIDIRAIPLNVNYYYSDLGTISGLNNYFTVRFDAQRFQQKLKEKLLGDKLDRLSKLDSLDKVKQSLLKRKSYLSLLKADRIAFPVDSSLYENFTYDIDSLSLDTLGINTTYDIPDFEWNDSLQNIYEGVTGDLSQLDSVANQLNQFDQFDNPQLDTTRIRSKIPKLTRLEKAKNIMQKVKKFEIGMCYPNYSQFLVARTPIKGINLEIEDKKLYFAFTHGKTVNNIFLTNNLVNNNLNAARNLYNFFNFNNIEDGRKVTAFKVGYGSKKSNHIHFGMLYGLGKTNYLDTSALITETDHNAVFELDARLKIKEHSTFDFVYGKSAIQTNSINYEEQSSVFNALVNFNDRTNAFLSKYEFASTKTGTKVSASFRLIDPFYRSFGVGFIRSDNVRYQVKLKQKITKRLNIGGLIRREEDNLLKIYDFNNTLFSYGANLTYRPTRHWMIKVDFRPISQNVTSSIDTLNTSINNWIINGVVNYNKRIKDTYLNFSNIYSHYQLFNGEDNNSYINYNSNLTLTLKNGISETFSFNYFNTTDSVSTPSVGILQNEFSWQRPKGLAFMLMIKASFSSVNGFQPGYGGKISIPIYKSFSFEASGEKLVLGDFYNSILQTGFEDFPFYFNASVKIRW